MQYKDFGGLELSALGFGTMRLPVKADGTIDEETSLNMFDYAFSHGINYFDTAYPYHNGESELVTGRALARYPRENFFLADKYPGHQAEKTYNPAVTFEEQLEKCGVDYFDFYLLHNINENSFSTYTDERWGILDYFVKQKKLGRIRHLGFSCHSRADGLEKFLDYAGNTMEFCQIQLNYLDWTLQDARRKYDLLTARNIPVWVMEPLRGGRLVNLTPEEKERFDAAFPGESPADTAFRFLQSLPNVTMVLSGMSSPVQMKENIKSFEKLRPLSVTETDSLLGLADGMKNSVPCTACRYCCKGCPKGLDIPGFMQTYNNMKFSSAGNVIVSMQTAALDENTLPSACVGCGACERACPQNIHIPQILAELSEMLKDVPEWETICEQRKKDRFREDKK